MPPGELRGKQQLHTSPGGPERATPSPGVAVAEAASLTEAAGRGREGYLSYICFSSPHKRAGETRPRLSQAPTPVLPGPARPPPPQPPVARSLTACFHEIKVRNTRLGPARSRPGAPPAPASAPSWRRCHGGGALSWRPLPVSQQRRLPSPSSPGRGEGVAERRRLSLAVLQARPRFPRALIGRSAGGGGDSATFTRVARGRRVPRGQ